MNLHRFFKLGLLLTFAISSGIGCAEYKVNSQLKKGSSTTRSLSNANSNLISYKRINDITEKSIRKYIEDSNLPGLLANLIKIRRVSLYEVKYKTQDSLGAEVDASGLLLVPDRKNSAKLMSFHHWTIDYSNRNRAPSLGENPIVNALGLISTLGFYISIPDYLGYGAANTQDHHLLVTELQAKVSYDMLKASKALILELNKEIDDNNEVFLAGYGQGADVSLALHKYIESLPQSEFQVVINSIGGGFYDYNLALSKIFQDQNYTKSEHLSWLVQSHVDFYGVNLNQSEIFVSPYDQSFDHYGALIELPDDLTQVFNSDFMDGVINGTYIEIAEAFDLSYSGNFESQSDIFIYHGRNDEFSPIEAAYSLRDDLRSYGNEVQFWDDNTDHNQGISRFMGITFIAFLKTVVDWSPLDFLYDLFVSDDVSSKAIDLSRDQLLKQIEDMEKQYKAN